MSFNHENCLLALAKQQIQKIAFQDELLSSILLELTLANALSEAYEKTFNSIYWRNARNSTKNRVSETLNNLAFKCFDHVNNAIKLFNEYCDKQAQLGTKIDKEIYVFKVRLEAFLTEVDNSRHFYEVRTKQLKLF